MAQDPFAVDPRVGSGRPSRNDFDSSWRRTRGNRRKRRHRLSCIGGMGQRCATGHQGRSQQEAVRRSPHTDPGSTKKTGSIAAEAQTTVGPTLASAQGGPGGSEPSRGCSFTSRTPSEEFARPPLRGPAGVYKDASGAHFCRIRRGFEHQRNDDPPRGMERHMLSLRSRESCA